MPLGRKAFGVLERLVGRPGRLVTKDDLLATVWPDVIVGEAVLTTAARELRRALGDSARAPSFIETVHGRGYRFIAPVRCSSPAEPRSRRLAGPIVDREAEWEILDRLWEEALRGERRFAFIAGEAGIGKTSLVESWLDRTASASRWIGTGRCIESHGGGEPFLPLLEALDRLGREPEVAIVVRHHAPSWLQHLPEILPSAARDSLSQERVTSERMLRELVESVEAVTERAPLVLVLEDLHWSDPSTLEWIAYAARRPDPARLLVLATYRPVDAIVRGHPFRTLVAELRHHPQCTEILPDVVSEAALGKWLEIRWEGRAFTPELLARLHRRTGGHPLFFVAMTQELERLRAFTEGSTDLEDAIREVPASVRSFIENRLDRLTSEDRELLGAASVVGDPFSVAAVAAAVERSEADVEARCSAWAREGELVVPAGSDRWPDGTVSSRYRFRHALHREVVYSAVADGIRARFHSRIGARIEEAWGDDSSVIAVALAFHAIRAQEPERALPHFAAAADNALARSAHREAMEHVERALEILREIRPSQGRSLQELELQIRLAQSRSALSGWADPGAARAHARVRDLAREVGSRRQRLLAAFGALSSAFVRADLGESRALARELLELAPEEDRLFRVVGHLELGGVALHAGDPRGALADFRVASELYDPGDHSVFVETLGCDMGLFGRIWSSHAQWAAGRVEEADRTCADSLSVARDLAHPFSRVIVLAYAAMLAQLERDVDRTEALSEEAIQLADDHGFAYYRAWARALRGWVDGRRGRTGEGITRIETALETLEPIARIRLPYYRALLAETLLAEGRRDDATSVLAKAVEEMRETGELLWEAELRRLLGERERR